MKKLIKTAAMVIGTMALFAGCSGDVDSQYEKLLREMSKDNNATARVDVETEMKKFKAMTPEQKAKELKETQAMFDAMK